MSAESSGRVATTGLRRDDATRRALRDEHARAGIELGASTKNERRAGRSTGEPVGAIVRLDARRFRDAPRPMRRVVPLATTVLVALVTIALGSSARVTVRAGARVREQTVRGVDAEVARSAESEIDRPLEDLVLAMVGRANDRAQAAAPGPRTPASAALA